MKSIKKGDRAIYFKSIDYLGNTVDLDQYKGKRVLLSLLRGASCPFCNMRVRRLIKHYEHFKNADIAIIVFFGATKEEIQQYAGKQEPPFPIVPDPNLSIYKQYDIEQSSQGMFKAMMQPLKMMRMLFSGYFNLKSMSDRPIIPADFLINEHQIIHRVHYGKDFGDHLPIDDVLAWKEA